MTPGRGPVGIFDSGVGGLTVVRALLECSPRQPVIYLADQAHVPYGDRELDEVRAFATAISRSLAEMGCRAVIMACNISSATAMASAADQLAPIPVVGVIEPAVQLAFRLHAASRAPIGLLATRGTVESGAYQACLARAPIRGANAEPAGLHAVACPELVPLIEAGDLDGTEMHQRCAEYLRPLADAGCETIILGCTHYPLALRALKRVAGELFARVPQFVDPSSAVVEELSRRMALPRGPGSARHVLLTTAEPGHFRAQATEWLGPVEADWRSAAWRDGALVR